MDCEYQYDSNCTKIAEVMVNYVDPNDHTKKYYVLCKHCLEPALESLRYFGVDYSVVEGVHDPNGPEKVIFV